MKHLLTALLAMFLLATGGCGGSTTAALDYDSVRLVIDENISIIVAGINGEDVFLASQPVSEQFTMDNNVATRYAGEWSGEGVGSFRNYWNTVFTDNANIAFSIELSELTLSGDLATVSCTTDYSAQLADIIPPETRVSTEDDELQFERVNGQWLLRRWEPVLIPEPEPAPAEGA